MAEALLSGSYKGNISCEDLCERLQRLNSMHVVKRRELVKLFFAVCCILGKLYR